jgi:hypothetical protein
MSTGLLRTLFCAPLILAGFPGGHQFEGQARAADRETAPSTATAAETRLILERGIKALGGEEKLARYRGSQLKGEGKLFVGNNVLRFTGSWRVQGADKAYSVFSVRLKDITFDSCTVVNGMTGWIRQGEETKVLDREALYEEKEHIYLNWVTSLLPLRDQPYKLTLLPESKLKDRPLAGFNVAAPGHRDLKLFFDKDSGLLLKTERQVRDLDVNQEVVETIVWSDHKDVDGLKVAMKYYFERNGKKTAEVEIAEAKMHEKLDDKWFQKP